VQDFAIMKRFEPSHYLNEYVPNFLLLDVGLPFLVAADFLEHIPIVSVLHHQTEKE
jgi:hypothetical protein